MRYLVFMILLILQGEPKTIADYFRLFPYKGDLSLEESEKNDVTIDIPNSYIKIISHGEEDYPFDSEMVFVYFLTATKEKIFGVADVDRGPNTDRFGYSFYKYDQRKWVEVTAQVLPEISFELFAGDIPELDAVGNQFQVEMTLPQKGTTIEMRAQPVGETDHPFSDEEDGYRHYIGLFHNLVIELKWNREKGIFERMK